MSQTPESTGPTSVATFVDWPVFMTDSPPGTTANVLGLDDKPAAPVQILHIPELTIYCDQCKGEHRSRGIGSMTRMTPRSPQQSVLCSILPGAGLDPNAPASLQAEWNEVVLQYYCRRCNHPLRMYVVRLSIVGYPRGKGAATKVGEWPLFAPRVPSKLITLIGPDRELFLKGRRAECDGLGIGAFSYYRRVVENQKNRLLDEIIKVAQRRGAAPEAIATLTRAKSETQFSKAVDDVKDAIPDVLRIKGHNPLTLLHSALSEGLHAKSDDECLGIATSIRIVMGQLAEQMAHVLRNERELDDALNRLLNPPA